MLPALTECNLVKLRCASLAFLTTRCTVDDHRIPEHRITPVH